MSFADFATNAFTATFTTSINVAGRTTKVITECAKHTPEMYQEGQAQAEALLGKRFAKYAEARQARLAKATTTEA